MSSLDALLNIQQVAEYLQLNQSTVYQWAQNGRLPALKLGGRWRFRQADLDAWLDRQSNAAAARPAPALQRAARALGPEA